MTIEPRVSVVIPAYNEDDAIVAVLDRILESVTMPCEVLIVAFPQRVLDEELAVG